MFHPLPIYDTCRCMHCYQLMHVVEVDCRGECICPRILEVRSRPANHADIPATLALAWTEASSPKVKHVRRAESQWQHSQAWMMACLGVSDALSWREVVTACWLTWGARWEPPAYTKGLRGLALVLGRALCGSKFVAASWLTLGVCPESPICACRGHGFTST